MNNKVEVIAPTSKTMCLKGTKENKLIRACAYCRVSTDNEDQKTSYDSQRIHYKNMIEENPDWEFVGIYADEGITGTQTKKREQFNQMMNDALNSKIDLILAKSISRFARNTVDTLNCVRLLREHNVDVSFEKENIHTLGLSNELFLTLYSAFAQAESESISENVKAGVRMKMKRGELVGKYAPFGYLYDKEKDIIYPDESKKDIITYIFEEYSKGVGFRTIALNLNSLGIPSPSNLKWCHASVRRIITNEKYVGDLKTGKYYTENVLTHKKIQDEISKLENKLSNLIDLQLDGTISKEILNQKNLEISNKIKEYEQQLKDTENVELTRKQKLEQIDKISNTLKQYKGLTKFNEEVFNSLVDKIIIGEKLENGKEDFYKIKFILKTGELINENLPNGKLDIGSSFGKYGFTITKQELVEKEDNVSAYVLQRHTEVVI